MKNAHFEFLKRKSGRSLPGAGECVRAKAAPLVSDRIVENVSNVSICVYLKAVIRYSVYLLPSYLNKGNLVCSGVP